MVLIRVGQVCFPTGSHLLVVPYLGATESDGARASLEATTCLSRRTVRAAGAGGAHPLPPLAGAVRERSGGALLGAVVSSPCVPCYCMPGGR